MEANAAIPKWGKGAPANNDWDSIDFLPQDQSEGLPDPSTVAFYRISPQLTEHDDFDGWEEAILHHLRELGLENLVNINVPRPFRNAPNASHWASLSKMVNSWMYLNISPAINKAIAARNGECVWADEFMKQCRVYFKGEGHQALSEALVQFFRTRYADCDGVKDFAITVRDRYHAVRDLDGGVTPYDAVAIICVELKRIPKFDVFTTIREEAFGKLKRPKQEVTNADLGEMIRRLITLGEKDSSISPVGTARLNNSLSLQQRQGKKVTGLMGAPPWGKKVREHVAEWKSQKLQRTASGACTFCGNKGHDAKACYHLVPDIRPKHWKPTKGLWYLKVRKFKIDMEDQIFGKPGASIRQKYFVTNSAVENDDRGYDFGG